jgi:serine/threonine-protein kinase
MAGDHSTTADLVSWAAVIGEVIGNFRITSKLGAGGMGEVYLAEQRNIETKVAVKVLRPEISADHAQVERFFNEARAVSRIKHAGTVKIFDVGFHATGHAYLIMEFLEGETLASRIHRLGKLALAAVCDIGKQTAGVLEATHAAGITHRDLKPDNIYLVPDAELASRERVKILDFGIAKLTGMTGAGKPVTVGTMGTPAYMAPEQWGDAGKVDWRADIYSLGCVAFEMCAGRPPFVASNFAEACAAHLGQQPPKLRAVVPAMPEQLEAMVDAMLSKSPYHRPPLREVGRVFDQIGAGVAEVFAETLKPAPRPSRAPSAPSADRSGVQPIAPSTRDTPAPSTPTPVAPSAIEATMPAGSNANLIAPTASTSMPQAASSASSSMPRASSSPAPAQLPAQTTLSSASVVTEPTQAQKKSRAPLFAIGGLVVIGGGIAAVVAATSGSSNKTTAPPDAGTPTQIDAAVVVHVDAAPPPRTWTKPELADINGVRVMPKQATRAQYADYLSTLDGDAKKKALPLDDWSTARPNDPVAWVTWEQARAFCRAAGGDLLSSDQWIQAAGGSWRVGPPAAMVFRDWTATTNDGLADVLGGHTFMATDAERIKASKTALQKPIDAGPPTTIADRAIGIRCTTSPAKPAVSTPAPTVAAPTRPAPAPAPARPAPAPARPAPAPAPSQPMPTAPKNANCLDSEGLEQKGDAAMSGGNFAAALALFESALACGRPVLHKTYFAACRARSFAKAKTYFEGLSNKGSYAQICLKEGFDPRR